MLSNIKRKQRDVADRIERAISDGEKRTSVEFVIIFAPKSGPYADVDILAGTATAFAALLFLVLSPWGFSPWGLPLNLAASFFVGWGACRFASPVRRLLTTKKRRERQSREGSDLSLVRHGVFHTKDRTGLLIYVSWFERRVEVFADVGIRAAVPRHEWNLAEAELRSRALGKEFPESFIAALSKMADLLSRHLPPVGDNPNEIPDRPVML